jgi:hypothetical protein
MLGVSVHVHLKWRAKKGSHTQRALVATSGQDAVSCGFDVFSVAAQTRKVAELARRSR